MLYSHYIYKRIKARLEIISIFLKISSFVPSSGRERLRWNWRDAEKRISQSLRRKRSFSSLS